MVKLNTGVKVAALLQVAQTETIKFIDTARTRLHRTAAVSKMASHCKINGWLFFRGLARYLV
jgi:hypothetical protein